MRIGAHMSVAGGVSKAVERAVLHGCEALQIFAKNANRWVAPPLDPAEVRTFRRRVEETGITPVVSHGSYLINLATTVPALRAQSLAAFIDELDRAEVLGLAGVVIHPGTCTAGTEDDALRLIAEAIRAAFKARPRRKAMVLLEHTAGQGRTVGHRFEHLAAILEHLAGSPRVGICIDTCHLVASGYDIVSDAGYRETFETLDRLVGLDRVKVFHGNDSKRPCGSRIDRHEHIGDGCLGLEPFRRLLHDPRFAELPLLIETEKSGGSESARTIVADPLDVKNLSTLRRLRDRGATILPDQIHDMSNLLEAFADAWNRHDLDALMSMMTDDCVFEASAGNFVNGERHEGQPAVRAAFAAVFAQYPDAHWGDARHFVTGNRGVSEWTFTGTLKDGKRVEVAGCDLLTLRDGKIAVKNSFRKNRPPIV